jgi:predicted dehydrogenase
VPGLALNVIGSGKREIVEAKYPGVLVCSAGEVPTHPDVDLVVIASPNESHFPLAAAALRAGKDVVVDKPFTATLAEARSLAEIAEKHNRILSVFHNRRWDSEILATKAIVETGVLGEISHYESHIDRFRPVVRQRWREDPGPGAGLWFDLGPHLIDQALHLFGLPTAVNASVGILRKGGLTDDDGSEAHHHPCKCGSHHAPANIVTRTLVHCLRGDCLIHRWAVSSAWLTLFIVLLKIEIY